jgi:hypothetical protein
LGQVFGNARDWDVFCTQILPDAEKDEIAKGWVELLRMRRIQRIRRYTFISARFATSSDTTWLSAISFLDLVKLEIDYRRQARDVSGRLLVWLAP